jgi:hypothetical protein
MTFPSLGEDFFESSGRRKCTFFEDPHGFRLLLLLNINIPCGSIRFKKNISKEVAPGMEAAALTENLGTDGIQCRQLFLEIYP